ncbi:MAG: class I SAM-dependent methyltransferase, partial [Thermoplasmata archaeon]|nr:class I SAM-dependent methyltransferase [Thermoplasmata archaeon]
MTGLKLNLGCGQDIRPKEEGWVNIDSQAGRGIDRVYDMHDTPLPFEDSTVDYALASHVLEHMHDWEKLILDVHRMLKPGGMFEIRVPYGVHPTAYHVRFFDEH